MAKNDIVQITNEDHHWYPALVIVDEEKNWGCQGYCTVPSAVENRMDGQAYIRLKSADYEKVGTAIIVVE